MEEILKEVKFDEKGLIPVIIQDVENGEVLMVAYMNKLSLEKTLDTGYTHFWSRSRNRLWMKGEESGHTQKVEEVRIDCDSDTLLVKVDQKGAACHMGYRSCFFRKLGKDDWGEESEQVFSPQEVYGEGCNILEHIYEVVLDRKHHVDRQDSYVASLFRKGPDTILKKVAEEAAEVILSCKNGDSERIISEVADLFFCVSCE
jgi:phosphoribosyl-ATP pyrophosphohydrolase/phosphoribosyl-AMP cyclohydrolase